jgi:hypothetical protein
MLLQLRNEGFITDADIAAQAQILLHVSNTGAKALTDGGSSKAISTADEYYDDEE